MWHGKLPENAIAEICARPDRETACDGTSPCNERSEQKCAGLPLAALALASLLIPPPVWEPLDEGELSDRLHLASGRGRLTERSTLKVDDIGHLGNISKWLEAYFEADQVVSSNLTSMEGAEVTWTARMADAGRRADRFEQMDAEGMTPDLVERMSEGLDSAVRELASLLAADHGRASLEAFEPLVKLVVAALGRRGEGGGVAVRRSGVEGRRAFWADPVGVAAAGIAELGAVREGACGESSGAVVRFGGRGCLDLVQVPRRGGRVYCDRPLGGRQRHLCPEFLTICATTSD